MPSPKMFLMLDLECTKVPAEAYFNDIPVARVDQGPGKCARIFRPVHEYVIPGADNVITLSVAHGERPGLALAPRGIVAADASANARLTVSLAPEGAYVDDPAMRVLREIRWHAPGAGFAAPVTLHETVNVPAGIGWRWSWADAAPVSQIPPDALKDSIFDLLIYLRESLRGGNPEPYIDLAKIRFHDVAAAYQLPPEERMAVFREQVHRVSSEPGWDLEEIDRGRMDLRPCAGARLVECVDINWLPTLRTKPLPSGSIRLRFPTLLANVRGAWRIAL